jgi:DNA repair protein RadC
MASLAEIFGRIVGDEYTGVRIADYLAENPHARANELVKFRGVGMNVANTLLMVMESSAEYLAGTRAVCVTDPATIVNHVSWLKWERQENVVIVTLDAQNHIIGKHIVTKGLVNETKLAPREAFRLAILDNAVSVIFAHNHPSGSTEPSEQDIALTRVLTASGKILQIPVLDHIVISRSGFSSLHRLHPELFEI